MAQRERRERERNQREASAHQMGQRLRRERERLGECVQSAQPTYFPGLTPSRRRRACLEVIQSVKKRTMAPHPSICSPSMPSTSTSSDLPRNW